MSNSTFRTTRASRLAIATICDSSWQQRDIMDLILAKCNNSTPVCSAATSDIDSQETSVTDYATALDISLTGQEQQE